MEDNLYKEFYLLNKILSTIKIQENKIKNTIPRLSNNLNTTISKLIYLEFSERFDTCNSN